MKPSFGIRRSFNLVVIISSLIAALTTGCKEKEIITEKEVVIEKGNSSITGTAQFHNLSENDYFEIQLKSAENPDYVISQIVTDTTGKFEFNSLKVGTYQVSVKNESSIEKTKTISINLSRGTTANLNVQLTASGNIKGNITLSGQTSHRGTEVYLAGTSYSAYTDATGDYEIRDVPIGSYSLFAMKDGFDPSNLVGITVTTGANGADPITLAASPGGGGSSQPITLMSTEVATGCPSTGTKINIGFDDGTPSGIAGNDILEAGEIVSSHEICDIPVGRNDGSSDAPRVIAVNNQEMTSIAANGSSFYTFSSGNFNGKYSISLTSSESDLGWELYSDNTFSSLISSCNDVSFDADEDCLVELVANTNYFLKVRELSKLGNYFEVNAGMASGLYDDFSDVTIDTNKWWIGHKGSKSDASIDKGVLVQTAVIDTIIGEGRSRIWLKNPQFEAFKADVRVRSFTNIGMYYNYRPRVRLGGFSFSTQPRTSTDMVEGDLTGEVWTDLRMYFDGEIRYYAGRCDDYYCNSSTEIMQGNLSPVDPSLNHNLAVGLDGDSLLFMVDGLVKAVPIDTSRFPIVTRGWLYPRIETRLGGQGADTLVSEIDNVYIGSSAEMFAGGVTPQSIPDTGQTVSYTTTFGEDSDIQFNPPSFTDNFDGTVRDNVTGLIWQQTDDDVTRDYASAVSYCSSDTTAGANWRLPTATELLRLANHGTFSPAIDSVFSGTNSAPYWSVTEQKLFADFHWWIDFQNGITWSGSDLTGNYVRCVAGSQTPQAAFYAKTDTIVDQATSLEWQKGEGGSMDWESALTYCSNLELGGHTDWLLPNVKELQSLLDYSKTSAPLIDTAIFTGAINSNYWTSTTGIDDDTRALDVRFGDGATDGSPKVDSANVRCVRYTGISRPGDPTMVAAGPAYTDPKTTGAFDDFESGGQFPDVAKWIISHRGEYSSTEIVPDSSGQPGSVVELYADNTNRSDWKGEARLFFGNPNFEGFSGRFRFVSINGDPDTSDIRIRLSGTPYYAQYRTNYDGGAGEIWCQTAMKVKKTDTGQIYGDVTGSCSRTYDEDYNNEVTIADVNLGQVTDIYSWQELALGFDGENMFFGLNGSFKVVPIDTINHPVVDRGWYWPNYTLRATSYNQSTINAAAHLDDAVVGPVNDLFGLAVSSSQFNSFYTDGNYNLRSDESSDATKLDFWLDHTTFGLSFAQESLTFNQGNGVFEVDGTYRDQYQYLSNGVWTPFDVTPDGSSDSVKNQITYLTPSMDATFRLLDVQDLTDVTEDIDSNRTKLAIKMGSGSAKYTGVVRIGFLTDHYELHKEKVTDTNGNPFTTIDAFLQSNGGFPSADWARSGDCVQVQVDYSGGGLSGPIHITDTCGTGVIFGNAGTWERLTIGNPGYDAIAVNIEHPEALFEFHSHALLGSSGLIVADGTGTISFGQWNRAGSFHGDMFSGYNYEARQSIQTFLANPSNDYAFDNPDSGGVSSYFTYINRDEQINDSLEISQGSEGFNFHTSYTGNVVIELNSSDDNMSLAIHSCDFIADSSGCASIDTGQMTSYNPLYLFQSISPNTEYFLDVGLTENMMDPSTYSIMIHEGGDPTDSGNPKWLNTTWNTDEMRTDGVTQYYKFMATGSNVTISAERGPTTALMLMWYGTSPFATDITSDFSDGSDMDGVAEINDSSVSTGVYNYFSITPTGTGFIDITITN